VSEIYEDSYTELGKSLASKLTTRFKCPFYTSFNIDDELLQVRQELYYSIEKDIFDKLKEITHI
jgi:hypothetical protein